MHQCSGLYCVFSAELPLSDNVCFADSTVCTVPPVPVHQYGNFREKKQKRSRRHARFLENRVRAVFFGFLAGTAGSAFAGYMLVTEEINRGYDKVNGGVAALGQNVEKLTGVAEEVSALRREILHLKKDAAKQSEFRALVEDFTKEKDSLEVAFALHKGAVETEQAKMFNAIKVLQRKGAPAEAPAGTPTEAE